MSELTFAQPARRNYTVPILLALVLLGIASGLIYHYLAMQKIIATVTQTTIYPVHTTFKTKRPTKPGHASVVDQTAGEYDLYVVPSIRIENHLTEPAFIKDFIISLTTTDGEINTSAIEKRDLDTVYTAFPDVKPLMSTPLYRESEIAPGQSASGSLLAQFAIPQTTWDKRQSATITIDFYHQDSITILIPKP